MFIPLILGQVALARLAGDERICPENALPHLGAWCLTKPGPEYEPKRFFHTARVMAHHVHYLSALWPEADVRKADHVWVDEADGAVLQHFRSRNTGPDANVTWLLPSAKGCSGFGVEQDSDTAPYREALKAALRQNFPDYETSPAQE